SRLHANTSKRKLLTDSGGNDRHSGEQEVIVMTKWQVRARAGALAAASAAAVLALGLHRPDTAVSGPDADVVIAAWWLAWAVAGVGRLAGDRLWSRSDHALGPAARSDAVARAWPRWWTANRAVIGRDPNLIRPGQRLVPPAPSVRRPR